LLFARIGSFAYRHRRVLPLGALALLLLLLGLSGPFGGQLSSGGFTIPGSQSQRATNLLTRYFGAATTQLLLVYQSPNANAASPAVQAEVDHTFARLAKRPDVSGVLDYTNTKQAIFIGNHGYDTFAVIDLKLGLNAATDKLPQLRSYLSPPEGMRMWVTGAPAINALYNSGLEQQLQRAELIALPVCLVLLVIVFGSVMAALLPLVIAGLSVPTALAVISLIAAHFGMSIFVTNVATIIGLGLAIDYSLFFVKRFREEVSRADVETAVRAATASAGKAVAISGTAVAVGLSSLILFPASSLRSMGIGGVVVVLFTLLFAVTALPALLSLLGDRINRLSWRRGLGRSVSASDHGSRFWGWVARSAMRHPVAIALPTVAMLLLVGTPFLNLRLSTGSSIHEIPAGPAQTGYAILNDHFPQSGGIDDLNLVLRYPGSLNDRVDGTQQQQLATYLAKVRQLKGVQRVDGVLEPPTGMSAAAYSRRLAMAPGSRTATLNSYIAGNLAGPIAQFEIANSDGPASNQAATLVRKLRALPGPTGSEVLVTGGAAQSLDFLKAFDQTIPWAVLLVIAVTMLVLFLTFGSVILPIKAALMSMISISASFGAMVWIFQEGHLSNLLQFTAPGSITATDPVLMFAILFGLSMDYEVFLLSRIRESYLRTGDNRQAVAEGLELTGGVITSAALIMITVFAAFALGHVLDIQILGVGMAVAVAVDATLVRGILVPSLMRLLGDLNWWAPRPLKSLVARLGLYEERELFPGPEPVSKTGTRLSPKPDSLG